jgi:hypothetical protein
MNREWWHRVKEKSRMTGVPGQGRSHEECCRQNSSIPLVYFNIRLTVLRFGYLGRDDNRDILTCWFRGDKKQEYLREGSVRNKG